MLKKKDNRDNSAKSRAKEQPVPQSPWDQAAALMERGETAQALEQFGRTAIQTRDLSRMDMAERWLRDRALLARAGEKAVCHFVACLTQVLDPMEPEQRERLWSGCLQALRALGEDTPPRQDMTDRYTAECLLLRHMGRMEEALRAAKLGIERHDSASCWIFGGLCCLDMGDADGAERYIQESLKRDPENLAPCNDLADHFLERGNLPKAIQYYKMAAVQDDAQDAAWAELSLIYCRWLETKDPMELERLVLCAASYPGNPRGAQLCQLARSSFH